MATNKKKPSIKEGLKEDAKLWLKGAKKGVETIAMVGGLGSVGAKVGVVAGKAVARKLAEEASPKILKAANAAKGAGKTVNPKPAMGKVIPTAPKRDVVVKGSKDMLTQKGTLAKEGKRSVPTNIKNPNVRIVEKEVKPKTAAQRTKSSNQLRYGGAKAEAARGREAIKSSDILPRSGAKIGKTTGAVAGATAVSAKKKKK